MLVTEVVNAHEARALSQIRQTQPAACVLKSEASTHSSRTHLTLAERSCHCPCMLRYLPSSLAGTCPAGAPRTSLLLQLKVARKAPMLTCVCQGAAAAPLACSGRDRAEGDPLVGVQSSHESVHSCAHSLQQAHAVCGCG